eukprot:CAMPEP_0175058744 /NCGR_PEP_ID=MMETSP0052_2-20121109/12028_1 /TAXON_ID=51329 ORGANISM="Polytomella parva, Strain SAG 63-3" /NCGR_SAMPLE_ID=MMETSP0052_2 /ASSEMBLY_ACC=CAM_ASM_000194 /LENGTH=400 /DNA_ID=CAMNT_0016324179 /DNA_START=94 /DNA_END=1292 /DNA_ORIENTATION=+
MAVGAAASRTPGGEEVKWRSEAEALNRDKNQAIDQLDKLRALVREKLGDVPMLPLPPRTAAALAAATAAKKKKKAETAADSMLSLVHLNSKAYSSVLDDEEGGGNPDSSDKDRDGSNQQLQSQQQQQTHATPSSASSTVAASKANKTPTSSHSHPSTPPSSELTRIPTLYQSAIDLLKKRNEKMFMILAIHELGDVYAHLGDWTNASIQWNDALDTLLGPYQVIRCWRQQLVMAPTGNLRSPNAALRAYGVHGLFLTGGVICGKLARYVYSVDNLQLQLETCRLGAALLSGVFAASATSPQRACDFAAYVPREIWTAASFWTDPYVCPVGDLLAGLETVTTVLVENGFALESLPVIALWEHVTRFVTRSIQGVVLARLWRSRACVSIGQMAAAAESLVQV